MCELVEALSSSYLREPNNQPFFIESKLWVFDLELSMIDYREKN